MMGDTFAPWTSEPLVTEFADGNIMVLPLMRRKGIVPFRPYYESVPPGVYGGPIFSEAPSEIHIQKLQDALNEFPSIIILGNPFCEAMRFPEDNCRELHTHVLDLRIGMERIEKRFRKGHIADISAARRKGVEISVAAELTDVDEYFAVYQNSLLRWGQTATGFYPKRLFRNLFHLPQYGKAIKLWIAKYDGRVVAGAWILYHRLHAVYWHGAVHTDYMRWHPVHLMLAEAIKSAVDDRFRWFDFNPSGGLKGVEHFKRGFGAEQRNFFAYRRLSPLGKAFRAKRYVEQAVFRRCTV
jgi:hypothetical protein